MGQPTCDYCGEPFYAGDGVWDDGDYTCGNCLAVQIERSQRARGLKTQSEISAALKNGPMNRSMEENVARYISEAKKQP